MHSRIYGRDRWLREVNVGLSLAKVAIRMKAPIFHRMSMTEDEFSAMASALALLNGLDPDFALELMTSIGDTPETDGTGHVIARDDQGREHRLPWPVEEPNMTPEEIAELMTNHEPANPTLAAQLLAQYAKYGKPWERGKKDRHQSSP